MYLYYREKLRALCFILITLEFPVKISFITCKNVQNSCTFAINFIESTILSIFNDSSHTDYKMSAVLCINSNYFRIFNDSCGVCTVDSFPHHPGRTTLEFFQFFAICLSGIAW